MSQRKDIRTVAKKFKVCPRWLQGQVLDGKLDARMRNLIMQVKESEVLQLLKNEGWK